MVIKCLWTALIFCLVALGPAGAKMQVAAGGFHSVLLRDDGTVWAWGDNAFGHLGDAPTRVTTMWPFRHSSIPLQVISSSDGPLTNVIQIAAGYHFTLALCADGTIWAWGSNAFGQLGDGSEEPGMEKAFPFTRQSSTPVKVRGSDRKTILNDIVALAAGYQYAAALRKDGTVWAWGSNSGGQLGNGNTTNTSYAVQVKGPGGEGYLTDVRAIAAGVRHTVALRKDGTLWTWGSNSSGQLGYGTNAPGMFPVQVKGPGGSGVLSDVQAIAAGVACTMALKKDGSAWAWGDNTFGQLGDGTRENRSAPVQVKGENGQGSLAGISAIAAGRYFAAALKRDGTMLAWGFNEGGLRGDGTREGSLVPVAVKDSAGSGNLSNITAIAAGSRHILAVDNDGVILAWGDNHCGQLGDAAVSWGLRPVMARDIPLPPEVTHGEGRWALIPRTTPGTRVPTRNTGFKWAQRYCIWTNRSEAYALDFTAVSNGHLTIAFEARVSSAQARTLDVSLLPDNRLPETINWREAWFIVWGRTPGTLSACGSTNDIAGLDTAWHHYEVVTDLDLTTYDLLVDGKPVAKGLKFRWFGPDQAVIPYGRLRIGTTQGNHIISGNLPVKAGEYADIANIRISNRKLNNSTAK
ncbi:MAG: hypothetical protein WC299_04505 [Kiritimatiellia bacterium]